MKTRILCPACKLSLPKPQNIGPTIRCPRGHRFQYDSQLERASLLTSPEECRHRGAYIREEACTGCGDPHATEAVYVCELHGECADRAISISKRGSEDIKRIRAIKSCLSCEDCSPSAFDFDGQSLWRMFEQTPRAVMPGVAVVTAADERFWPYLQLLAVSLELSHDVRRYCIDLGLTELQREWLGRHGMSVTEPPPLVMPKDEHYWQSWNKPAFIEQIAANGNDQVLWLDADTFVVRSIEPIIRLLQHQPVLTPDIIAQLRAPEEWQAVTLNHESLYHSLPVDHRIADGKRINAGVLAIKFPRDTELLQTWIGCVRAAAESKEVRDSIRWWDQGALLWSLEKLGVTDVVTDKQEWNDAGSMRLAKSLSDIAWRVSRGRPSVIYHVAGDEKPLLQVPNGVLSEPEESRLPLKVFVLGHNSDQFRTIAQKHYLEFVRLDQLPAGSFEHSQMAEFRFFCSDPNLLEQATEEYLGCASASWNTKYKTHNIDQVWDRQLSPKVVWAAAPVGSDWTDISAREHPGSEEMMEHLIQISGVNPRRSLWSNNFIAHRTVALELQNFFREVFGEFHRYWFPRVGWGLPFNVGRHDPQRRWAYIGERISMLFFSSRPDLEIRQL